MVSSRKKVIVRTNSETTFAGYLPSIGITRDAVVDLLDLDGRVLSLPLSDIKTICYVRDFNLADSSDPERLTRRSFPARPRTEGLWVRVMFVDGDTLEGLAALDRSLIDAVRDDCGVYLMPPDVRSNTQRLFVPHAAIAALEVLGVVTSPSKARGTRAEVPQRPTAGQQEELFTSEP